MKFRVRNSFPLRVKDSNGQFVDMLEVSVGGFTQVGPLFIGDGLLVEDGKGSKVDAVVYGKSEYHVGMVHRNGQWGSLSALEQIVMRERTHSYLLTVPTGREIEPPKNWYAELHATGPLRIRALRLASIFYEFTIANRGRSPEGDRILDGVLFGELDDWWTKIQLASNRNEWEVHYFKGMTWEEFDRRIDALYNLIEKNASFFAVLPSPIPDSAQIITSPELLPAKHLVEAFNARDLEKMAALLAHDATAEVLGSGLPVERGREEISKISFPYILGDDSEPQRAEVWAEAEGDRYIPHVLVIRESGGAEILDMALRLECGEGSECLIRRIEYLVPEHQKESIKWIAQSAAYRFPPDDR